ncbi:hypothetical protein CAEBREN_18673 [Caenorhabditis brenneri]|uniref:Uncharacterized protein n=1 Tax=Caenorhabditis brenneri TaxID=135651 RepID=G0MYC7_CAEBE|nr:hypothetical protein CAEBREN_18673 [Caenorhabditis brenneri]
MSGMDKCPHTLKSSYNCQGERVGVACQACIVEALAQRDMEEQKKKEHGKDGKVGGRADASPEKSNSSCILM